MARQFDLFRLASGEYALVVQTDLLDDMTPRTVCLAIPETDKPPTIAALSPVISNGDLRLRLAPYALATVSLAELESFVANFAHDRDRIIRAFDVLLTGI